MKNITPFARKTLVLHILAALPLLGQAAPYQQGTSAVATVDSGERVEKIDSISAEIKNGKPDRKNPVGTAEKDFNRSGNPVRIIWYGNPNDKDSKIAQTGALNNGFIHGKVSAKGTLTTKKSEKGATVEINGQANAIDALGWTPASNPNDIDIKLDTIDNRRFALGEAELQGGVAGVHGNVGSFGSANGISVVAIADFGKATGGSGGVDGSSGATGKSGGSSSGGGRIAEDENNIDDNDLLGLINGEEEPQRSPKNTERSDMYGKTLKTAVSRIENSGSINGKMQAKAQKLKRPLNKNSYTPQFYGASTIASGNGVSMANYIETPDKYTYSQEKQNHIHLGNLNNSGRIGGNATLEGGTRTTHTYAHSKSSGNGVSLYASTGRFAKNATRVSLDNVNNGGRISGSVRQTAGDNSGYNSTHLQSTSEAYGSGNGISLYSDTFNARIPRVETRLGSVNNRGSISGDAYLKAGNGSGDLSINARASGNGISVYQATGNSANTALGNLNNEGIIKGRIETRAGTVYSSAQRGQTIPEERARLVVSDAAAISAYYKANPTPEKPAAAGNDNYGSFANFRADSDIRGSGNGISVQHGSGSGSNSRLGDIDNRGVISGYAENYHGYARGYGRVEIHNSGTGIASDNKITSNITNRGIISGNHAAILAKGSVNTAYNIYEPEIEPGYENGKVKNYGLMAGSMIAGSYRGRSGNPFNKEQRYDHFDSSAAKNDPLENHGSKIYLKTGISRANESGAPTVRSDDYEHIVRIENGAGGVHTIGGQTYTITNGRINASGTDSEHRASGKQTRQIINGAGVAHGALIADGKLELDNSIVNGYANALYLPSGSEATLNNSILNTNGFKVNRSIEPLAARGDAGANRLNLGGRSTINGNIDLGAGDDQLTIADSEVRINGTHINFGAGNDTLHLGRKGGAGSIKIDNRIDGVENIQVNQASQITADAVVRSDNITLNNADLTYQIDGDDKHAFYDAARTSDITLRGNGKLLIDTYKDDKAEREISIGGSGKLLHENGVNTASTNNLQTASLRDGKIIITPRSGVQSGQNTAAPAVTAVALDPSQSQNTNNQDQSDATTVGSLVRIYRDGATIATFDTPYLDAYNSYTDAWRKTGNNPLKNSAYLPEISQTDRAVNQYLKDIVEHNPYGAVPAAALAGHQDTRRELLDNHARNLRQGETYAAVSGSSTRNNTLKNSDSKAHDNRLGIGISHGINDNLTVGATFALGREKINGSHNSRLKGNTQYAGVHAVQKAGDLTLTGGMSYGRSDLKGTRSITNGYDAQQFSTRIKPGVASAYAEGKYTLKLGDSLSYEPKVSLAYNRLKSGGAHENGSGGLDITSRRMNIVDAGIGQDLTLKKTLNDGTLSGKLSLDYIHSSGTKDLTARFSGSNSNFTIKTDNNPHTVRIGLGGEYENKNGLIIRAGVSDNIRKSRNDWQANFSVGVKF